MKVEVVYATENEQKIVSLELADNVTVHDAVVSSGLQEQHREIEIGTTPVGIYGERVKYETLLHDGDRVEIYRPLLIDPMDARRLRAQSQKKPKKQTG